MLTAKPRAKRRREDAEDDWQFQAKLNVRVNSTQEAKRLYGDCGGLRRQIL